MANILFTHSENTKYRFAYFKNRTNVYFIFFHSTVKKIKLVLSIDIYARIAYGGHFVRCRVVLILLT